MVFVFGVDVPLVELILIFSIITFVMLLEVTVVMLIMFHQMKRSKENTEKLVHLTHILFHLTRKEQKYVGALARLDVPSGSTVKNNGHNGHSEKKLIIVKHKGGR